MGCVPGGVAKGFLFQVAQKGLGKIHPGLVGYTDEDKQNIGQLIGELEVLFPALEALVSIGAREDPGNLANLLHQLGEIGQLGEIPYTDLLDPAVNAGLGIGQAELPGGLHALVNRITQ